MSHSCLKLTLVTNQNKTPVSNYLEFIKACAEAGVTAVQLRDKQSSYQDCLAFGQALKDILTPFSIPLIINDNIDLAIALDAEGVHLGQTDGCPITARQRLGSQKIIGISIDSVENLLTANQLPIDYVGVGAIFPTNNKNNVATLWGLEGLSHLSSISKHPIIAIGGINESNAEDVMCSGAQGIAVIGAIHDSVCPTDTVKKLRATIDHQGLNHE